RAEPPRLDLRRLGQPAGDEPERLLAHLRPARPVAWRRGRGRRRLARACLLRAPGLVGAAAGLLRATAGVEALRVRAPACLLLRAARVLLRAPGRLLRARPLVLRHGPPLRGVEEGVAHGAQPEDGQEAGGEEADD